MIVNLGDSSTDEEGEETKDRKKEEVSKGPDLQSADSLMSSIDLFLKQARASVEVSSPFIYDIQFYSGIE